MTVRELIVQLMAQPQDAEVVLNVGRNERANGKTPKRVEVTEAFSCDRADGIRRMDWVWREFYEGIDDDFESIVEEIVVIES